MGCGDDCNDWEALRLRGDGIERCSDDGGSSDLETKEG